jgi:alpha-N-arabinofuranosidase
MSEKTFAGWVALMLAALVGFIPGAAQTTAMQTAAKLTIHADQPVSKVSPTLYGLMTEEINYSYDGGLYAEMVRNRTFG